MKIVVLDSIPYFKGNALARSCRSILGPTSSLYGTIGMKRSIDPPNPLPMANLSISLPDELVDYLDRKVEDKSHLITSILQQWRQQQEAEELARACAAVDELELGWTDEWQTAAIIDSERDRRSRITATKTSSVNGTIDPWIYPFDRSDLRVDRFS